MLFFSPRGKLVATATACRLPQEAKGSCSHLGNIFRVLEITPNSRKACEVTFQRVPPLPSFNEINFRSLPAWYGKNSPRGQSPSEGGSNSALMTRTHNLKTIFCQFSQALGKLASHHLSILGRETIDMPESQVQLKVACWPFTEVERGGCVGFSDRADEAVGRHP